MTKPPLTKERVKRERMLIGRALICIPTALAIVDVLTPGNFRDPLCERVFVVLLESVESMELDLMSVTRAYNKKFNERKSWEITNLTSDADTLLHPMNEALHLLESDIKEKFCDLMSKMERDCAQASDFEAAAIWKQCYDHLLDPRNDVFKSVESLQRYLQNYFPDQMDDYNELMKGIPKMIDRIRKRAKTRKFIDTITNLHADAMSHEHRMCIRILSDWLIYCMSGTKLPDNFYSTLNQLNTTWNV